MKATEITEELELQIIEYYKNNAARDTVKHFHIRLNRLNDLLAKHNVEKHAKIKTELSEEQVNEMLAKYSTTTDLDICREFHISKPRLYQILEQNSIQRHSESENRSMSSTTVLSKEAELELVNYYTEHNITDAVLKFGTNKQHIFQILEKYGVAPHTPEEIAAIKSKNQSLGQQHRASDEVKEFLNRYTQEEFTEWYYAKPNCEIQEHFGISVEVLYKLKKKFGLQGRDHSLKYYKDTDMREAISVRQKKRFSDKTNHPFFGKHHSEDTKLKISKEQQGTCNFRQTPESIAKNKATRIANAGSLEASYTKGVEKLKQNMLEMYGVTNAMQIPEIAAKSIATKKLNNTYETACAKAVQTKQKLAEEAGFSTHRDMVVTKTCEELNISKEEYYKQWRDHVTEVLQQNGTFNTSKLEDNIEQCLIELGVDFVHGYSDPQNYPFICDFYLPQTKLFLEIHGTFTHGGRPFDPEDKACIEQLEKWQSRANEHPYYKSAIYTWTDLDIRKVKTAEENNLNFKALYLPCSKTYAFYKQKITDLLIEQNIQIG